MADTPNTPSNARMTWDHAADHCLLMCMIEVLNPTQENLRLVTEKMHAIGYTCTTKAITYYSPSHHHLSLSLFSFSLFSFSLYYCLLSIKY